MVGGLWTWPQEAGKRHDPHAKGLSELWKPYWHLDITLIDIQHQLGLSHWFVVGFFCGGGGGGGHRKYRMLPFLNHLLHFLLGISQY